MTQRKITIPVAVGKFIVLFDLRPSTTETVFWAFRVNLVFKTLCVALVSTKECIN